MKQASILVVDDDPVHRLLLAGLLERTFDTEILTARCGREALELLRTPAHNIALVMLDIHMPECDGIEVLLEMAEIECGSAIIIMSAKESILPVADRLATANGLNVLKTAEKPIDGATTKLIGTWMHQYRSERECGCDALATQKEQVSAVA